MTTSIGFIGLGLLGQAMAQRLINQGHSVTGFDVDAEKIGALKQANPLKFTSAESCQEVAGQCSLILVCVTHTAALTEVVTGPAGRLGSGASARSHRDRSLNQRYKSDPADCSSGRSAGAPSIYRCPGVWWAWCRAGPAHCRSWPGGAQAAIETVRPLMETLGRFTHMGAVGAGQATKLVNQALVLPTYCVIAEAFRLAQAYGIDASKVPRALETGHAGSNLLPVLV